MADTYTTASKARLIEDATRSGTWGPVINSDSLELIDDMASGIEVINLGVATSKTMASLSSGSDSESRAAYLRFTGTPASAVTVTVHSSVANKMYFVDNQCGQKLTLKYSSGSTVVIENGDKSWCWCDGSDVYHANTKTGTFTPVVEGSSTTGTGTYSVQLGRYHKVGRLVTFRAVIQWTAHTGTGNLRVTGLPYTAEASINAPVTVMAENLSYSNQLVSFVEASTTRLRFVQQSSAAAFVDVSIDTAATLFVFGSYFMD